MKTSRPPVAGRLGLALIALAAVASMSLSGCTSYRILKFEDHATQNTTQLETLRTTNWFFWTEVEHQFWLCEDTDDALECEKRCGSGTDLECPTAAGGGGAITTNVR